MNDLIITLLPILVAGVTTYAFDALQKGVTLLDKLPALAKQLLVASLAFGLTKASVVLGVQLTTVDPTSLTQGDLSALISASLAYVFHLGGKTKAVAKATTK